VRLRGLAVKPCGVLFALQEDTSLHVEGARIELSAGDALVFTGDTVHSGAGYGRDNTRIHVYLDTDTVCRERNTTFLTGE